MVKTHIDKSYEADLTALREQLLVMGGLVEAAIAESVRAIIERDGALAEQVVRKDRVINRMEVEVDGACRRILALRQPAASDLRFITTALKIVTDLERMGDLAVNIARRAVDLAQAPALRPLHDLGRLATLSEEALRTALDAFVTADPAKAEEVLEADDHLDTLYLKIFNELLTTMMEDPRAIRRATSLMFSAKHLERFGDHATNLAEMVIFMVKGTDVRHAKNKA
jgi:phosphate transport system protein